MPKDAQEKLLKEVERLAKMTGNTQEAAVIHLSGHLPRIALGGQNRR